MITKEDLLLAHERIKPFVHRTPIISSSTLNDFLDCEVHFKCENFQKIGAFKARGAFNFALSMSKSELSKGMLTHSSGNHAQAVAYAAKTLNTNAYIVMPENAPQVKIDGVLSYGGKISFCKPTLNARESTAKQIQNKTGAIFIPPYNHNKIIAGAATAAKELIEEVKGLDIIITPIGGGGLLSGTALSAKYFEKNTIVIGAEPKGADDAKRSFDSGNLVPSHNPKTIADGLLTSVGSINFEIIKDHVSEIITVSEEEIKSSMRFIWERMKVVVEPSSAVALAIMYNKPKLFKNKKVGIILSGGNVDLSQSYF
ncbi:MAG: pyridoxal-phosphate dependent enzyme [Salibacteraceae bacterium]